MKIKVLKLLSDRNLGGVNKTMEGLINSPLGEKFEFLTANVSEAQTALRSLKPDIAIFHDSAGSKYLEAWESILWEVLAKYSALR